MSGGWEDTREHTPYDATTGVPCMETQDGWRWCNQCYALAYGELGRGECLGEQGHNLSTSGAYLVSVGDEPDGAQPGWRWCADCQCLVFAGGGSGGTCAQGTEHDVGESGAYSVLTPLPVPVVVEPRITVDVGQGQIAIRGEGFTPDGAVNIRYIIGPQHVDVPTRVNSDGLLWHIDASIPSEGNCLVIVRDEASGRFTAGSAGNRRPRGFPSDPVPVDPGTEVHEA